MKLPGIYVRNVLPGTPAALCGHIRVGDRILAVNGRSIVGADYNRFVKFYIHDVFISLFSLFQFNVILQHNCDILHDVLYIISDNNLLHHDTNQFLCMKFFIVYVMNIVK